MIPRIVRLLAFLSILTPLSLQAQVTNKDTANTRKQVEIIRFSGEDDTPKPGKHVKKKKPVVANGALKTAPLSFIMGYLPLFYEREINDYLGIQVGAGVTFKPVAAKQIRTFYSELYDSTTCPGGDCNYNLDYAFRTSKISFMFSLSPRYYISKEGMDGPYIAPEIRFYNRKSEAQKVNPFDPQQHVAGKVDAESVNTTDLMIHFGHQTLSQRLTVDWNMGAGVRLISGRWQQVYLDEFGLYQTNLPLQHFTRFHIDFGLRIGLRM
jgi:hypothetical protein